MDIIDILIAKKKSFTGETETLVKQAQAAMAEANKVAAILEDAEEANAAAQTANEAAQESAQAYEELVSNLTTIVETSVTEKMSEATDALATVDEAIIENISDSLNLTKENESNSSAVITNVTLTRPDETSTVAYNVVKNYKSSGNNEDGSMTQKAITAYVQEQIAQSGSGSGSGNAPIHFNTTYEGHFVAINDEGNLVPSDITEQEIAILLAKNDALILKDAVGVEIDYENKTFTRTYEAANYNAGVDFDKYSMYGGRTRCIVNNEGRILSFYGDSTYNESQGQVMVYQPKFYYQRVPLKTVNGTIGKIIKKESIVISPTEQTGLKLHPLFKAPDGTELEYVLLPAYDGGVYITSQNRNSKEDAVINFNTDMLTSVPSAKPIGGLNNNFTIENAEKLASNRGAGWHITNMAAESALQMLELVEFGSLNGQESLGKGICNIAANNNYNCASYTGSTSNLGNTSGRATATINEINGIETSYTDEDKTAINYRGTENPWGNFWHFVGGVNIYGDTFKGGGIPYICTDFNYSNTIGNNYKSVGFNIPSTYNWISGFGYGNLDYDWVFIPAECSSNANSLYPVGDYVWTVANLNNINQVVAGGNYTFKEYDGPFCYGCDKEIGTTSRTYGAKLMHIPVSYDIYEANYSSWQNRGER